MIKKNAYTAPEFEVETFTLDSSVITKVISGIEDIPVNPESEF